MKSEEYRSLGRPFAGAAIMFIIMNPFELLQGPFTQVALRVAIWASFSGIMFLPKSWWSKPRIIGAAIIITSECISALIWLQEKKWIYFLAIFLLAAAIRLSLSKSPVPAIAALLAAAWLYMGLGRNDVLSFLSFVVMGVAIFFILRSRMQRIEMYELNKRHLAELQEAYDQLQEASAASMQNAVLEERTRIAREIHDSVGHSLTSLIVQMQALRFMVKNDPPQAEQVLEGMLEVARQGLHDIRTSVHALAEDRSISGLLPLKAILSRMEAATSTSYSFHADLTDEELDADRSGILFRLLQEAVTNIIRHSQATKVDVDLKKAPGCITLTVRDNGDATSSDTIKEGFGLKMMKERLEEKGGRLQYKVLQPHGFEVAAELPVED